MFFRRVLSRGIQTHGRGLSTLPVNGNGAGNKPYYLTTPIFYPNSVPHIGHLYSIVTGDAFVRYANLVTPSRPTNFLIGTDEHGLKIQKAAQDKGLTPQAFVDELSVKFRELAIRANISNTQFMRTSGSTHKESVSQIWEHLQSKGLIYPSHYEGWYSVSDETFYTPAQVLPPAGPGLPHTSAETGSAVEWAQETNYKFRLSAFRDSLHEYYATRPESIRPSQHHAQIMQSLDEGLDDLSISRPKDRVHWAIPVPGDENQTMYVWFEALLAYVSGAQGAWPPDMQVIGKDILRFHAIYLPAILQALDKPLSGTILAHAHWTMNQKKMSKSIGNVADPLAAIDALGIDAVRYYLLRVGGKFRDDVDWSQEQLEKHAAEVKSLLGNFFLRVASPSIGGIAAKAPQISLKDAVTANAADDPSRLMLEAARSLPSLVADGFARRDLSDALGAIVASLKTANVSFTQVAPWSRPNEPALAYAARLSALESLRITAICLLPFVPGTAGRLLESLGVPKDRWTWSHADKVLVNGNGSTWSNVRPVKLFS